MLKFRVFHLFRRARDHALKVIAGVVLMLGLSTGAIAQNRVVETSAASVVIYEDSPEGCNLLFANASETTVKQGGSSFVSVVADFTLYRAENGLDCLTFGGGGSVLFIAAGFTDNQLGFTLTIDGRLMNAVLRTTIPATNDPDSIGELVLDLSFQGTTGELSPFRSHSFVPSNGTQGVTVTHERGYGRPTQVSGTAVLNGINFLANPFLQSGGLFTQTGHTVTGKTKLLR